MSTNYQLFNKIFLKKKKYKTPKLHYKNKLSLLCPVLKSIVVQLRIITPKKPNSARRPAAKVLLSNKKKTLTHIPGIGHNLRKHSEALVRGKGARDLPGVNYTFIRGAFGLMGVINKLKRRSIYGTKLPDNKKKKLRRKLRKLFS